jgi:hypothetical protein
MKPNWEEAPHWANYFCVDLMGAWWSEQKPERHLDGTEYAIRDGRWRAVESDGFILEEPQERPK